MKQLLALLVVTACSSSPKPDPAAPAPAASEPAPSEPAAAEPAATEPAATPAPAAGHLCYDGCMANGPDDSPMTKTDWPKKSQQDKENACNAACADAEVPGDSGAGE